MGPLADISNRMSNDADSLLLGELKRLKSVQFEEVVRQLLFEIRLEPRKIRNKPAYFYAETVSMQDQNRVIVFITKRDGTVDLPDIDSLANHSEKVRAPRSILITTSSVSPEAEREGHRRGVQVIDGTELSALIRKSGVEDMILQDFAETTAPPVPPGEDTSLEAQLMLGVELLQAGEFMRALEHFDRSIASNPNSEMAWRLKGEVLDQLGHHGKALECYARALELDPDNPDLWYAIGMSMYALGKYEEELECYEKALKLDPKMEKALVNRGATLLKLQRYEEALTSYDRALKLNYRLIKVHNNRGIALRHLERLEEALEAFDAAIGLDPDFSDAWLNKGALLHQLGKLNEAIEAINHVVKLRPSLSQAWVIKAEIESRLGHRREAIDAYEKALEIDPTNLEIKRALDHEKSKVHAAQEDVNNKITSIFRTAGLSVADAQTRRKEMPVEVEIEDVEVIRPEQMEPEEPEVQLEAEEAADEIALDQEEPVEIPAEEPSDAAITLPMPIDEDLLFEEDIGEPPVGVAEEVFGDAAELMLQMGRPEVSLDELEKGLRLEPLSIRMLLLKGRTLYLLGRDDEALTILRKATEIDPANEQATYSIEYLLSHRKDCISAEEALHPLLDGKHWIAEILAALNLDLAGKVKKVSESMDVAISLEPSAIAWNYKGLMDLDQGDFESAIEAFTHSIEQEESFSDPLNNKGVAYLKLGVRAEGSMHFDRAISANPRNSAAWNNRGVLLYSFDRHREALACFDQAIIYDNHPLILINRGFTLLAMDDLDNALKAFDESLSIDETAEAYNNKGIVLVRMNRLDDAINCFEAALHIDPDFEDAKGNLERYQPEEIRAPRAKRKKRERIELPSRTPDEVMEEISGLTESAFKRKKKKELMDMCSELGLSNSGTKKELIGRILAVISADKK